MSDWIQETLYANGTLINKLGIRDAQDRFSQKGV
mgnify:CR=1 FL=1